jgi:hypothetical protein
MFVSQQGFLAQYFTLKTAIHRRARRECRGKTRPWQGIPSHPLDGCACYANPLNFFASSAFSVVQPKKLSHPRKSQKNTKIFKPSDELLKQSMFLFYFVTMCFSWTKSSF